MVTIIKIKMENTKIFRKELFCHYSKKIYDKDLIEKIVENFCTLLSD